MTTMRKIIEINEDLCNGCGNCIISCAEGALEIVDGKARLVAERYCDGLGACLGECPTGALKIMERPADDFDEKAVELRLEELKKPHAPISDSKPCGCPSMNIRTFERQPPCEKANKPVTYEAAESALTNWPVQIRLIPPTAPFLRNAHLLVLADCTPIAYPTLHRDFLDGKVVMVGCPKFDDSEMYLEKFTEIFRQSNIRSVTVLAMEVPCCQGLPMIVTKAMERAGKTVPTEYVIIGVRGDLLKRQDLVA